MASSPPLSYKSWRKNTLILQNPETNNVASFADLSNRNKKERFKKNKLLQNAYGKKHSIAGKHTKRPQSAPQTTKSANSRSEKLLSKERIQKSTQFISSAETIKQFDFIYADILGQKRRKHRSKNVCTNKKIKKKSGKARPASAFSTFSKSKGKPKCIDETVCPNCFASISSHSLRNHLRNECKERLIQCEFNLCNEYFPAKHKEHHELYECERILNRQRIFDAKEKALNEMKTCPYCNQGNIHGQTLLEEHILLECIHRKIRCKHCNIIVRASDEKEHIYGISKQEKEIRKKKEDAGIAIKKKVPLCKVASVNRKSKDIRTKAMADLVPCPNVGCKEQIPRILVIKHSTKICPKREISCPDADMGCPLKFPADELKHHFSTKCIVRKKRYQKAKKARPESGIQTFSCPNLCRETFETEKELLHHTRHFCESRIIQCPQNVRGCTFKGPMHEFRKHYSTCVVKHRHELLANRARVKRASTIDAGTNKLVCLLFCGKKFPNNAHGLAVRNEHINSNCPMRRINCRFLTFGCKETFRQKDQEKHEVSCIYVQKNLEKVKRGKLLKQPIKCDRPGCGMMLKDSTRVTRESHQSFECKGRIIICRYCKEGVPRNELTPPELHACEYFETRHLQIARARKKSTAIVDRIMTRRRNSALDKIQKIQLRQKRRNMSKWC